MSKSSKKTYTDRMNDAIKKGCLIDFLQINEINRKDLSERYSQK